MWAENRYKYGLYTLSYSLYETVYTTSMKLPKLFVGIFGTLTIILSSINCLICEDGQNVVMEVHHHCYSQLSHIIELACGYMPDLKKKSISGKNFLFNGNIIFYFLNHFKKNPIL